jgi:hypothetical protein
LFPTFVPLSSYHAPSVDTGDPLNSFAVPTLSSGSYPTARCQTYNEISSPGDLVHANFLKTFGRGHRVTGKFRIGVIISILWVIGWSLFFYSEGMFQRKNLEWGREGAQFLLIVIVPLFNAWLGMRGK